MASSSSSSSSSKRRRSYDVFLSFRGTDVRNYFLGHLYTALDQSGINTYMDSEDLNKGEQISPALMEAIEESQIAIIVFSKDFASSPWCLEEVAKIMECKEQRGLMVFPVFYKVEPREVRGQRQGYAEAMAKHEVKFGEDSEKVKRWKKALLDAGSLSGWDFMDGYEAGLIQDIVQKISTQLDRTPLKVAKYPVGIDSRVQELQTILNLQSKDDILMIGLWGQGGIGKTTLAKAIYNAIFREFQGSSFLDRVSENSKSSTDLVHLQKKLLSQVLRKELIVFSVDEGSQLIQDRLSNKKVLIILDDVDDEHQLNALAGDCEWFGKGSRIIITTRNRHLLTSHGVYLDKLYKVTALECGEDLELFTKHAFPRSQKIEIRSNLVDSVLHYAKGLPLALQVLGSFLCGRGEQQWESTLEKLAKSPHKEINDVLKLSYDGLEDYVKEIFLDIACFFKGQETKYIREVLDSCDFTTTIGVEILIERSLISEEDGTLQMHDLIKWMGMEIVKKECCDDVGKHSRLWLYDDVLDVLSRDVGTDAIKAIVLKLPKFEETYICPNAFTNMRKLRLLILHNVGNSFQGPVHLPSQIRCLELHDCDLIPEFGYGQKRLVRLDMQNSKIKELPKFKDFIMLKDIDFSHCKSLTHVRDISSAPNLKRLNLYACESLVEVDQSVGYLDKLEFLSLSSCSKLSIFPSILKTRSLRKLRLAGCSKLEKFPDIMVKIEHLEELHLPYTAFKELPASIDNLVSVRDINLGYCKNLIRLPSSIYKLQNLGYLSLRDCSNFIMFPKNLEDPTDLNGGLGPNLHWLDLSGCNLLGLDFLEGHFPKLTQLYLSGNKFTHLPKCLNEYNNLECLLLDNCQQLQEIPQLPSNIGIIRAQNCRSLQNLPDFSSLSNFSEVDFSSCCGLSRKEFDLAGVSILEYLRNAKREVEIILTGGEMPGWIHHCEEGSISFKVPDDLRDKVLGLALCVVIGLEEAKVVDVQLYVGTNGVEDGFCRFLSLESDNVWLKYSPWGKPCKGGDWQVRLRVSKGSIKQCGFRLICQQQEDDLRVKPIPIETDWFFKERDSEEETDWFFKERDSEEENSTEEEDSPIETDGEES